MSKWKLVPIPITQEMIDAFRNQSSQLISLETCLYAAIDAAPSPPATAKDGMSEREKKLMEAARKALPILRDAMVMNVSGDLREFGGGFADRLAYDAVEEALAPYEGKEEGQ